MRSDLKQAAVFGGTTEAVSDVRSRTEAVARFGIAFVLLMIISTSVSAQGTPQIVGEQGSMTASAIGIASGSAPASALAVAADPRPALEAAASYSKLIVVGFVGGRVRASDRAHREVQLSRALQEEHGVSLDSFIFANRDGSRALRTILKLLDRDQDGVLSKAEKQQARIVIYGHSWGASQAITLARQLEQLAIPVLLTIQVDSVPKRGQDDRAIPANVRDAANFYQSEGWLRGESHIIAADPEKTSVLGNFELSYRSRRVSCAGYPWYAQLFMHRHIQIENDPAVWERVEALIVERIASSSPPSGAHEGW